MPNHFTTIAICSPGYEFNVEEFNERHKETCLCSIVRPMPEHVARVPSTLYPDGTSEKQRRGEPQDWHDWAMENWGTKWGTYDMTGFALCGDSSPIAIKFQSAWGPPRILGEIAKWLRKTYQFEHVAFVGFDPYDCSTKTLEIAE